MNRKLKTALCAVLVLLLTLSCCCVGFADEPHARHRKGEGGGAHGCRHG